MSGLEPTEGVCFVSGVLAVFAAGLLMVDRVLVARRARRDGADPLPAVLDANHVTDGRRGR